MLLESSNITAFDTSPFVLITIPIIHVTLVLSVKRKMYIQAYTHAHTYIKFFKICINSTLSYYLRDFNVVKMLLQQFLTLCVKCKIC